MAAWGWDHGAGGAMRPGEQQRQQVGAHGPHRCAGRLANSGSCRLDGIGFVRGHDITGKFTNRRRGSENAAPWPALHYTNSVTPYPRPARLWWILPNDFPDFAVRAFPIPVSIIALGANCRLGAARAGYAGQ